MGYPNQTVMLLKKIEVAFYFAKHCVGFNAPARFCSYLISLSYEAVQYIRSCRYRSRASENVHIKHDKGNKCDLIDSDHACVLLSNSEYFSHTTVSRIYTEWCGKKTVCE